MSQSTNSGSHPRRTNSHQARDTKKILSVEVIIGTQSPLSPSSIHVKTTTSNLSLSLSIPKFPVTIQTASFPRYESGTTRYETPSPDIYFPLSLFLPLSPCLPFLRYAVTLKPKRERAEKSSAGGVTPPPPSIPTVAPNPLPDLEARAGFPGSSPPLGLLQPAPESFCLLHSARRLHATAAVRVRSRVSFRFLVCLLFYF